MTDSYDVQMLRNVYDNVALYEIGTSIDQQLMLILFSWVSL